MMRKDNGAGNLSGTLDVAQGYDAVEQGKNMKSISINYSVVP